MILASLLSSSKYIIVNKDLIKILGLHESVILGELCSEYTYWENTNQLMDGEFFYSTRENIENNTGINAHFQRIAMKNLEQKGIITLKRMGIPCKIYYKINEESVIEYLKMAKLPVVHEVNNKEKMSCNTSDSSDEQQDCNEVNGNNNNINNKKNNNKEHTHESPTEEERKEYAKQVTMTEKEYQDLVNSYGEQTANQLIEQLSLYKQAEVNGNNNNINNKKNNNKEHTHESPTEEERKEYAKQVTMTEKEYQDLVNSYGEQTANQLIEQLSLYKQAKGTTYDNDYAAIIRWVTVRLHEMEKEKTNYDKFKKNQNTNNLKANFSQREYPPGFFDSLYANQQ